MTSSDLPPTVFVLFGATGDLSRRMVLPAFFDEIAFPAGVTGPRDLVPLARATAARCSGLVFGLFADIWVSCNSWQDSSTRVCKIRGRCCAEWL